MTNQHDRDNITYNPDHVEDGLDRLLGQFREANNIREINRIILEEVQQLEDALFDLFVLRTLELSTGETLDLYGKVVGERRGGRSDETYRNFIQARILSNLAQGDINRIIKIIRIYVEANSVEYYPMYPNAYNLVYEVDVDAPEDSRERIANRIELISPSGVGVRVQEARPDTFRFGVEDQGWGDGTFSTHIKKFKE